LIIFVKRKIEKKLKMKRILQILKIFIVVLSLPFEISKGSKRRTQQRIKKMMIAANLL